jgi:hypothetical protein
MSFQVVHLKRRPGAPVPKSPKTIRRPMKQAEIIAAVADIKDRVRRMSPPLNGRPEAFHEDKSEIVRLCIDLEQDVYQGKAIG